VVEAVRGTQMSVGRPYFDAMAVPIGVALLFLMGVGPALPWGRATGEQMRRALLPPLAGAAVVTAVGLLAGVRAGWTLVALAFAGYTAQVTMREMWLPMVQRVRSRRVGLLEAARDAQLGSGRRRFAAYVVHSGAALIIVAIAVSSTMGSSKEVQLREGQSFELGAYTLTFVKAEELREPHRQSLVARVAVSRGGRSLGELTPRMNQYDSQREPIGTPAVRTSWREDLYLSIMNVDANQGTLALLAMVNPLVGWIWLATAVMAVGGMLALVPAGRRAERAVSAPAAAPAAGGVVARG
jgi:cytochrome c-type biogenesis protein CcmF